ncbi:MAG: SDR family NAD(P)-dependent oxidoreductase, partial [Treponemataceae bacterium]
MRILVTGAAGFIGYHLCERLLARGDEVVGLDSLNSYYDPALKFGRLALLEKKSSFRFVKGDIADRSIFEGASSLVGTGYDRVCNLAAQAGVRYSLENPRAYIEANVVGFLNILEYCREAKTPHLLYASSSSVYGLNDHIPFSVDDRTDRPASIYAATKKADELMAHTYS